MRRKTPLPLKRTRRTTRKRAKKRKNKEKRCGNDKTKRLRISRPVVEIERAAVDSLVCFAVAALKV